MVKKDSDHYQGTSTVLVDPEQITRECDVFKKTASSSDTSIEFKAMGPQEVMSTIPLLEIKS